MSQAYVKDGEDYSKIIEYITVCVFCCNIQVIIGKYCYEEWVIISRALFLHYLINLLRVKNEKMQLQAINSC